MGKNFLGHALRLYLDAQYSLALVKLRADKELGRSHAGLLVFTEGLYRLGYINQKTYDAHVKRYSKPLVAEEPVTLKEKLEQENEKKTLLKWNKTFSNIIKQWNTMKPESQEFYIKKAEELQDQVPNAKLVLAYKRSVPAELFSNG